MCGYCFTVLNDLSKQLKYEWTGTAVVSVFIVMHTSLFQSMSEDFGPCQNAGITCEYKILFVKRHEKKKKIADFFQ